MDAEAAALLKENPCSTCKREVLDEEEALLCDICEWWEHLKCIKECDRPTAQCYNVLTESPSKSIVFTCSRCRRKGTLARRLFQAEVALENTHVQRDVYERLLQEKQQQIDNVSMERDALQLEKKELETCLEDARREIDSLKIDKLLGSERSVTIQKERSSMGSELLTPSVTRTASLRGNSDAWSPVASVPSSRRKLPQLPQFVGSSSKAVVTTRSSLGLPSGMVSTVPTVTTPVLSGLIPYCRGDVQ